MKIFNKRLLCLVLCLVMTVPLILSGCATNEAEGETTESGTTTTSTSRKAMTFTLYAIKDSSTTDEAIEAVQAELNKFTEAEFNTHLILKLFTESEYDQAIIDAAAAIEEQKAVEAEEARLKKESEKAAREAAKNGETTTAETTTAETTSEGDETIIGAYNIEKIVYPEEKGTQLDVFLVRGFEQYQDLQARKLLTALDEQLSINAKVLKQYIHPTFLAATKTTGSTLAIPNNHVLGSYTYLLLNKQLIDKYYYDPDNMFELADIDGYLKDIVKSEPAYTPLLNIPAQHVEYVSGNPSLVGSYVSRTAPLGVNGAPKNLLTVAQYISYFKTLQYLKKNNAVATTGTIDDCNNYAAAFVNGDYTTPELYKDDYYVNVYSYPTATNENVYSGMYAISPYASDVTRAMEIITALSTKADFVNAFTYGVENVNYTVNENSGLVEKLNNSYSINPLYTGNQFLQKPSADMDELTLKLAANNWELAKAQNLDMVYSSYLGYQLKYTEEVKSKDDPPVVTIEPIKSGDLTIAEIIKGVEEASAGFIAQLEAFEEYDREEIRTRKVQVRNATTGEVRTEERSETVVIHVTLDDFIAELNKEITADIYIAAAINAKDDNSPLMKYNSWYGTAHPAA